jgi:hypothetical protein
MKKILLSLAIVSTIFTANAQSASKSSATTTASTAGATFKFETEEYNFGNVKQGEVVTYEFKFTNAGKEPLIITNATAPCGCTVPSYPKEPIKPGEKGVIKVSFNTAGKMGVQDKVVTIKSNAKEGDKLIHVKGTVETKPVEETFPTKKASEGMPLEKNY